MASEQKPPRPKSKFLQFLPKAATVFTFHNNPHPFSPGREKTHVGRRLISLIPVEARRKPKNSSFRAEEPTSPRVSCMGQIQHRHKTKKIAAKIVTKIPKKSVSLPKDIKPYAPSSAIRRKSAIGKILGGAKPLRKSNSSVNKSQLGDKAPSLGQMRRFASGRDKFASFDWTAQIAPVDSDHHRNYYSDEERGGSDVDDGEDDVIIPFSAPLVRNVSCGIERISLEPRKEINLWKRRTMAQPRPLKL